MFTAFWEMQFNPFSKSVAGKHHFESNDFKQATARLKHLCDIKGIGLFTGNPGTGKTFTMKKYVTSRSSSSTSTSCTGKNAAFTTTRPSGCLAAYMKRRSSLSVQKSKCGTYRLINRNFSYSRMAGSY
jgi:type II secretory pathway predicted ATPase ExeA